MHVTAAELGRDCVNHFISWREKLQTTPTPEQQQQHLATLWRSHHAGAREGEATHKKALLRVADGPLRNQRNSPCRAVRAEQRRQPAARPRLLTSGSLPASVVCAPSAELSGQ